MISEQTSKSSSGEWWVAAVVVVVNITKKLVARLKRGMRVKRKCVQVSISLSEILFILFHMPTCDDGTLTRMLQCKLAGGGDDGSPARWKHGTYNFPLTREKKKKKMIIVLLLPPLLQHRWWWLRCLYGYILLFGIYFALFSLCNVSVQKELTLDSEEEEVQQRKKTCQGRNNIHNLREHKP